MTQLSDDCFSGTGRLMPVEDALAIMRDRLTTVAATERVPLDAAAGRIVAADLVSGMNVPPHDNSAVDGYAFRNSDLSAGKATRLAVTGRVVAGHGSGPGGPEIAPASAVRIFTGAVMPAGCDTVVMQEDVTEEDGVVTVPPGLETGTNRRRAGEDITTGSTVLERGQRLKPQHVGLAASVGAAELEVFTPLRIAIFSTGDEIREPGSDLPSGSVYDANRYMLAGLCRGLGATVSDLGILADDLEIVRAALAGAAADHDLILTSGGVSVGEEDHVKAAVEELGTLHFWRLAIKPGRPVALGQIGSVPFAGLPGNPVAVMVTFVMVARPMILILSGAADTEPRRFRVRAGFDYVKKKDRAEWVRARLESGGGDGPVAHKFERQGAGILSSIVNSEGFVELPRDMTELKRGSLVDFLPFREVDA